MKKLIIIRHAKSSWEDNVDDTDRSLSERGIKDAYRTSRYLADKIQTPDIVFSSPANRALHTSIIFLKTLAIPFQHLHITGAMYDFQGDHVITLIRSIADTHQSAAIFGHNHALTSLCTIFGDTPVDNLPTSGVAVIHFDVSQWSAIERGKTELLIFPKQLR